MRKVPRALLRTAPGSGPQRYPCAERPVLATAGQPAGHEQAVPAPRQSSSLCWVSLAEGLPRRLPLTGPFAPTSQGAQALSPGAGLNSSTRADWLVPTLEGAFLSDVADRAECGQHPEKPQTEQPCGLQTPPVMALSPSSALVADPSQRSSPASLPATFSVVHRCAPHQRASAHVFSSTYTKYQDTGLRCHNEA